MNSTIAIQALKALNTLGVLEGMLQNEGYTETAKQLMDYIDNFSIDIVERFIREGGE